MKKTLIAVLISVSICLLVGFLSGFATQSSVNTWYLTLNKPSFNPPNWLFAPVWTLLYIMMGIALGLVWSKRKDVAGNRAALYYFGVQLLLNASWSIVFFGLQKPAWALLVILSLIIFIVLSIKQFIKIDKIAAYLLVPYLLWVCFATALNFKIWQLN